jgi:hypothetical protein
MIVLRRSGLPLLVALAACGGGEAEPAEASIEPAGADADGPATAECVAPTAEALPDDASLAEGAGEWRFTFVATRGEAAGTVQEAKVIFEAHVGELRDFVDVRFGNEPVAGITVPLHGATDLDLEALGAFPMGGLDSTDPEAPGVQVYEARAEGVTRSITIRLGSAANRRGEQPIDGAATALFVREVRDTGFAGSWRSSSNMSVRAEGYFCAERVGA